MPLPGNIRIIAGQWRGRKLDVEDAEGLRPTPDRLRETLFNWLQTEIQYATCLDCFAGTGALGFEALSREAKRVVMLEKNVSLLNQLERHAEKLNSQQHEIILSDAINWLNLTQESFDIIFLDPPFHQGLLEKSLNIIKDKGILNSNGKIYIESENSFLLPKGWNILKEKKAGQVMAQLIN